jgi:LSD1 subclass zinc finger protein
VELVSVSCNHCGAPLEVPPGTNYVTCAHCGSRLAVKRTGSAVYTELLEKLDQKTDVMTRQLAEIAYRSELERLDREWEEARRGFLTTDKQGRTHEPNALGSQIGGAIAVAFGLFWTLIAATSIWGGPAEGPFFLANCMPLFGLVIVGLGAWMFVKGPAQAQRFEAAKQDYRRRRAAVSVEQFMRPGGDSSS